MSVEREGNCAWAMGEAIEGDTEEDIDDDFRGNLEDLEG